MAIFNITSTEADWKVVKEESPTDCSTAFTYTVKALQGDLIDMSLSDSFNNGRYYLNGVEATLGSSVVQVSFNNTLEIKFFIGNSGSAGAFLDALVTIVNGSDTYTNTAVRYNDSAACGSDVGCYECPPGPQGIQGAQGIQGIQGIDGEDGEDGSDATIGSGTDNFIVKRDGTSALQDSVIYGDDTNVGINETSPTQRLHVDGNARVTGAYYDSNNDPGTDGQFLSSTITGTRWLDQDASVDGVLLTTSVLTFSSGMKDIVANPIQILPAPGSNKVIRVVSTSCRIQDPGVGFNYSSNINLTYGDGTIIAVLGLSDANTTSSAVYEMNNNTTLSSTSSEIPMNSKIEITTTGSDATTGSAQVNFSVSYIIHNLNISL
tara:strand:+ start:278 stop:1408 length:1131 start_codon:yes stop_codon:yes gene_type:complete